MDSGDYHFSEEEIREQLERLGYHSVPDHRLKQFKKDLEKLVKEERGDGSASLETSSESSALDANRYLLRNSRPVQSDQGDIGAHSSLPDCRHVANGAIQSHGIYKPPISHIQSNVPYSAMINEPAVNKRLRPPVSSQAYARRDYESSGAKNASVETFALPRYQQASVSSQADYRQPVAAASVPKVHVRIPIVEEGEDSSVLETSSNSSDVVTPRHRVMKRKVLRKVNGRTVIDESVSESDQDELSSLQARLRDLHMAASGDRPASAPPAFNNHDQPARETPLSRLSENYVGPCALIRPMSAHPHMRNIKKSDPVVRYHQYRQSWDVQKAPGEQHHKSIRWSVREQMLQYTEVVSKRHKVYVPNNFVVPQDKKHKELRWQIRKDLALGIVPPSIFE